MNNGFDIPETTLKAWDREYRREFNKRNNIEDPFNVEIETEEPIRISGMREKELDPFYDPSSPRNSLAEQAKVYLQNPAIDAYMRKKFGLMPTMEY
jgi:hypothetical protein